MNLSSTVETDLSHRRDRHISRAVISTAFALATAAVVLLPFLGRKMLANWDEAIYAEVAREFLGRSWLIPSWQFQPWMEKPPLGMWITAVLFHLFGATQFWARAASALAGIGLVAWLHCVVLWARGLCSAWMATAILLTTFGFLRAARVGELDVLLTLGCYVALWGLGQVRNGEQLGWYFFWVGFAFAAMTKGAASFPLLLTAAILFVWNRWRGRDLGRPFVLGLLLFTALVLPWHLYMVHVFGVAFLREYFGFQVLTRATHPIQGHGEPWWYYAEVLLARASPWVLVFPFALAWVARRRAWREYIVFAMVVFIFYSSMATRTPKYIVPIYPAMALLTGDFLAVKMEKRSKAIWAAFLVGLLAAFGLASMATRTLRQRLTETTNGNVVLTESREGKDLLLAALRDPAAINISGPVLLWEEDIAMQKQALLFYVHRPMQQVYLVHYPPDAARRARRYTDPRPLMDLVTASPRLILLDKNLLSLLPGNMQFHLLGQGTRFAAGIIQLRASVLATDSVEKPIGRDR